MPWGAADFRVLFLSCNEGEGKAFGCDSLVKGQPLGSVNGLAS